MNYTRSPQTRLLSRLLEHAIREAQGKSCPQKPLPRDIRRARGWLMGGPSPLSFTLACDALGLEPDVVQEGLRKRGVL